MEVYFALNTVNGKAYVGMTSRTAAERFAEHCSDAEHRSNTYFHNAIRKYGPDAFNVITVWKSNDLEETKQVERNYIAGMKTNRRDRGYNMTEGGDGVFGYKPTPEHRAHLSAIKKGCRPQNLDALHEGNKGNKYALGKRWKRSAEANAKLHGNPQAKVAGHTRWHVNTGTKKDECALCQK